jgi:uncharacterized protein (DUF2236 family)
VSVHCGTKTVRMSHPVARLGPGALLWRYAGDQRLGFSGLAAGILQLMHPAIGAGVVQHSAFFTDPLDRIVRSIPEILGVIYDEQPERTGHRVRNYHRDINGVDERGRPYRALAPETYWWAHATFQHAVEQTVDRFDARRLDPHEREQLYTEGVEWYRRYGVSMRPVPRDHSAFRAKWHQCCCDVLEMTPAAERAVDMALHSKLDALPGLPGWTSLLQRHVVTPMLRLTAIGGLPPVVRARFAIPWGMDQELELKAFELGVRESWRFVPEVLRYHPRAIAGRRRERSARRAA